MTELTLNRQFEIAVANDDARDARLSAKTPVAPEGFRRDRFNQHWVCLETGAVCDADDVKRILEMKRLASLPPPQRQAILRAKLRQFAENL